MSIAPAYLLNPSEVSRDVYSGTIGQGQGQGSSRSPQYIGQPAFCLQMDTNQLDTNRLERTLMTVPFQVRGLFIC